MNWKVEAKEKLRRYNAMRIALVTIPQEIERLEIEYQRIRSASADGDPVRGGGNAREDALLDNIVKRQELAWTFKQADLWKQMVDRALSGLTEEEGVVLHSLYIYPEKGALSRVCKELGHGKSSIYRLRDKALHKFTIAICGAIET